MFCKQEHLNHPIESFENLISNTDNKRNAVKIRLSSLEFHSIFSEKKEKSGRNHFQKYA